MSDTAPTLRRNRLNSAVILVSGFAIVLPVAGVVGTALAGMSKGWPKALLIAGVVITTAGASLLTVYKDRQATKAREQAVAAVANLDTAVTGAGQPLVAVLGQAMLETDATTLEREVNALRVIAITGTVMQCGKSDGECRLRSAYYQLRQGRLELVGSPVGRAAGRAPRPYFKPSDGRVSRRVIAIARGSEVIRIANISAAKKGEFEDYEGREYEAVIAAPVRAGDQSFGLLVVDSDRPHSLTEADAEYVNLVAGILGAGYAHLRVVDHFSQLRVMDGSPEKKPNGPTTPQQRTRQSIAGDELIPDAGDDDDGETGR